MSTTSAVVIVIVAAVVVLLVIGTGLVMARRARRRRELQERFGPEYDRTVQATGSSRQAQADLQARAQERDRLSIRPLNAMQRNRYESDWRQVQIEFVDTPALSLGRADALVTDVMVDQGYPMRNFNRQADLISVDHPEVVEHYRRAHEIFEVSQAGQASTEELRQGFVSYRMLFDDLLDRGSDCTDGDVPNHDDSGSPLGDSESGARSHMGSVRGSLNPVVWMPPPL